MREVRRDGLKATRHLRGDIYETRAEGADESYRLIFAKEGRMSQILLSLHVISKKTGKTPPSDIRLAERRLTDWRQRGQTLRTRSLRAGGAGRRPDRPRRGP